MVLIRGINSWRIPPNPLMEHNQANAIDAEQPDPDHESHQPTAQNADNAEELPARYGGGRQARREEHHAEDGELGLDHVIEAEQERHQAEHAEQSDAGDAADGDQAERPARALILHWGLQQVQDDQSGTTQQAHNHEEEGRAPEHGVGSRILGEDPGVGQDER